MSIETTLAQLLEAMQENNELLREANEQRTNILETAPTSAKKPAAKKPAAKKPADDEDGDDDDDDAPAKKPAAKKPAAKKPAAKKSSAPTVEDIADGFKAFLNIDDDEEKEERKTFVKAMLKKLGAAKATEIEEEDRQWALDKVAEATKKGVDEVDLDEDEEDDIV